MYLHPPLTVFPPALISVVLLLELVFLFRPYPWIRRVSEVNLALAGVGVVAAFFSGYQAITVAEKTFKIAPELIATHHQFGKLLLFAIIPTVTLGFLHSRATHGKSGFRAAYLFSLALSFALVVYACYLGGDLVFVHGAGVRAKI